MKITFFLGGVAEGGRSPVTYLQASFAQLVSCPRRTASVLLQLDALLLLVLLLVILLLHPAGAASQGRHRCRGQAAPGGQAQGV